jgi:hypothetical protein
MALRLILSAVLALLLPSPSYAQSTGAESVFRTQLVDLHSQAIGLLERVEKAVPRGAQATQTKEEILALVRLVHRLEEEAAWTNVQRMQSGEPQSKTLLMVQQAAKAVDGMLAALDNYVTSADRSFLGFARDNDALVWSVRKVM